MGERDWTTLRRSRRTSGGQSGMGTSVGNPTMSTRLLVRELTSCGVSRLGLVLTPRKRREASPGSRQTMASHGSLSMWAIGGRAGFQQSRSRLSMTVGSLIVSTSVNDRRPTTIASNLDSKKENTESKREGSQQGSGSRATEMKASAVP